MTALPAPSLDHAWRLAVLRCPCAEAHPRGAAAEQAQQDGRDEEMEAELAQGVSDDPLAAFDVEVQAEGQAIQHYLAMLQAVRASPL